MSKRLSLVSVIIFILCFVSMAFFFLGLLPAIIFGIASVGGFVLWMLTTYRTPIDTEKLIVPYLFTIMLFICHVYEEYVTHFNMVMTDITGFHMLERDFLTIAAFIAPVMWVGGAILIIKRTAIGFYFLSFFYVAMMIAEMSHYVFPFLEDGTFHYVSGMYTAFLPLIPAGYGFFLMKKAVAEARLSLRALPESKKARQMAR